MEIGAAGRISTHINTRGYMGQKYPYSTIWEENIMVFLHIYRARTIFLLCCDHQDTESESREIEISIYQPIFNHKYTKGYMGQQYPYSTIRENFFVAILHIYGAGAIFYYFVITKTPNLDNEKSKLL